MVIRLARVLAILAILCACVYAPSPRAAAKASWTLTISAQRAEPVALAAMGAPQFEELFVYVAIHYSGPSVLNLDPWSFRLIDDADSLWTPVSYDGPGRLRGKELVGDAHLGGWLLFVIPNGAANVALGYKQTQSGKTLSTAFITDRRFTPHHSPARDYAVGTQPAFQAYLVDEALVAGYIRLNLDTLDSGNGAVAVLSSARAYLRNGRTTLLGDHGAFDRVAASGLDAQRLKARADAAFSAVEKDLSAVQTLRHAADWQPWRAAFTRDDHALADLYQAWPGLAWPVSLPPS